MHRVSANKNVLSSCLNVLLSQFSGQTVPQPWSGIHSTSCISWFACFCLRMWHICYPLSGFWFSSCWGNVLQKT